MTDIAADAAAADHGRTNIVGYAALNISHLAKTACREAARAEAAAALVLVDSWFVDVDVVDDDSAAAGVVVVVVDVIVFEIQRPILRETRERWRQRWQQCAPMK